MRFPLMILAGAAGLALTSPASATDNAMKVCSARYQAAKAAMHERQRQCGPQWKADKAAVKIHAGTTWPEYWSACNARLKH